jgi:beta-lactamase regulating signal transducer with metallopeptidase domain
MIDLTDVIASFLISNALSATVLALVVFVITCFVRSPGVRHALWLLVLVDLLTPAFFEVALELGLPRVVREAGESALSRLLQRPSESSGVELEATELAAAVPIRDLPIHASAGVVASDPSPRQGIERSSTLAVVAEHDSAPPEGVRDSQRGSSRDAELEAGALSLDLEPAVSSFSARIDGNEFAPISIAPSSASPEDLTRSIEDAVLHSESGPWPTPTIASRPLRSAGSPIGEPNAGNGGFVVAFEWRGVFLAIQLGASLCFVLALVRRALRFRRLVRHALPAPRDLRDTTARLSAALGLKRVPELVVVRARIPPLLWAWTRHPVIVLPEGLVATLDRAAVETILSHELAHLRRRDPLVRKLELFVLAIYWWHPVAWWARARLHDAEEECCDAWVVWSFPERARVYANALLETLEFLAHVTTVPPGASGVREVKRFSRRFRMILRSNCRPRIPTVTRAILVALSVFVLPLGWRIALAQSSVVAPIPPAPSDAEIVLEVADDTTLDLVSPVLAEVSLPTEGTAVIIPAPTSADTEQPPTSASGGPPGTAVLSGPPAGAAPSPGADSVVGGGSSVRNPRTVPSRNGVVRRNNPVAGVAPGGVAIQDRAPVTGIPAPTGSGWSRAVHPDLGGALTGSSDSDVAPSPVDVRLERLERTLAVLAQELAELRAERSGPRGAYGSTGSVPAIPGRAAGVASDALGETVFGGDALLPSLTEPHDVTADPVDAEPDAIGSASSYRSPPRAAAPIANPPEALGLPAARPGRRTTDPSAVENHRPRREPNAPRLRTTRRAVLSTDAAPSTDPRTGSEPGNRSIERRDRFPRATPNSDVAARGPTASSGEESLDSLRAEKAELEARLRWLEARLSEFERAEYAPEDRPAAAPAPGFAPSR